MSAEFDLELIKKKSEKSPGIPYGTNTLDFHSLRVKTEVCLTLMMLRSSSVGIRELLFPTARSGQGGINQEQKEHLALSHGPQKCN